MADYLNIAGRIKTTAADGVALEAQEVKDLEQNKFQTEINADVQTELADRYTKQETYSKQQLDNLITSPDVNYVSVVATDQTTDVTDVLPYSGEADTIYRVGNWNGSQYDTTVYSLYAWNGSAYVCLAVRSFVGEVYDISVNHPDGQGNPTPYADLTAALGTGGANIPADIRHGGMRIQFIKGTVQSSDNKYVQYRLTSDTFTTTDSEWQKQGAEVSVSQNTLSIGGEDKGELAGQLIETPEWIQVVTDSEDKILYGVKTDGKFYFGAGCPPQVVDYVSQIITVINTSLNGKVDKVAGKSLIDLNVASNVKFIDNLEYYEVKTDKDNRILEGINVDGEKEIYIPTVFKKEVTFLKGFSGAATEEYVNNAIQSNNSEIDIANILSFLASIQDKGTTIYKVLETVKTKIDIQRYYYHYHPNGLLLNGNGEKLIGGQSLKDIEIAKRLGFTFIEANTQVTYDGKYICCHGTNGKFGAAFISLDNTDISNVEISSKTLDWIKTNVRYDSVLDRYKVAPPTIEEFIETCNDVGIGLFMNIPSEELTKYAIDRLKDRLILYNAPTSYRSFFNGPIFKWNNTAGVTPNELLEQANNYGGAFMSGWGPNLYRSLKSNNQLEQAIKLLHNNGYYIVIGYLSVQESLEAFKFGVDFGAANYEQNSFSEADKVATIDDMTTSGTSSDGIISLNENDTISYSDNTPLHLGKVEIYIRFNGSLAFAFGDSQILKSISSDGKDTVRLSDYILEGTPGITITANSVTEIYDLTYKYAKC